MESLTLTRTASMGDTSATVLSVRITASTVGEGATSQIGSQTATSAPRLLAMTAPLLEGSSLRWVVGVSIPLALLAALLLATPLQRGAAELKAEPLQKPSSGKALLEALQRSGFVGMWENRTDIGDSAEFARRLRERAQER